MTSDSITKQEAQVLAEMRGFERSGIRSVFTEIDLTDIKSNTYKFNIPVDEELTDSIDEGEYLPRTGNRQREEMIHFDKFGFEITDDTGDGEIENRVEQLNKVIASCAAREVYDNVRTSWGHSDRLDIVETAIKEAGSSIMFDDQDIVVVPQVLGEAIANDDPTREWDEISDDFSEEYEVRVVTDQFNVLRGADVMVANTDHYGYEGTRMEPETNSYVEYERHDPARQINIPESERTVVNQVTQAYVRKGFAVMDESAAHIVQFGNV